MKPEIIKRNIIFIILIGIEGIGFGLLNWDDVVSDLVYLKYNNKLLISIITANIGVAKLIATMICIHINNSKKPNKIFIACVVSSAIGSLLIGITYNFGWLILFTIMYILETLVLEIYSAYHYAYNYNSLPDEIATQVHSKRIAVFKITFMLGIAIASFFTAKFLDSTITIVTILSALIFLLLILLIIQVKNFPKNTEKDITTLKEKLNLKKYTKYYRIWVINRILGKFALTSLTVLVSMIVIDTDLNFVALKTFKTSTWLFSSIGFWLSAYLVKNNIVVKGDIICKSLIVLSVIIIFFNPYAIFAIFVISGILNPFNTMSNFTMLQLDKDNINVAQKELIINLFGYLSGMMSSYILLNINTNLALIVVILALSISTMLEVKSYKSKFNK